MSKKFMEITEKSIENLKRRVWILENPPKFKIGDEIDIAIKNPKFKGGGIMCVFKGKIVSEEIYARCGSYERLWHYFDGTKMQVFPEFYHNKPYGIYT